MLSMKHLHSGGIYEEILGREVIRRNEQSMHIKLHLIETCSLFLRNVP